MAYLNITDATGRRSFYPLATPSERNEIVESYCVIGSSPDNNLVLDDPHISPSHAFIVFTDGAFVIESIDSSHVLINGEQHDKHTLRDGDLINLGGSTICFKLSFEFFPRSEVGAPDKNETFIRNVARVILSRRWRWHSVSARANYSSSLPDYLVKLKLEEPEEPQRDPYLVECTVFAPPVAAPRETLFVQVFAHRPEQTQWARALAEEFDQETEPRGFKTLEGSIPAGARLMFHLAMRGLDIDDAVQSLTWHGYPEAVQFGVSIPGGLTPGNIIGIVTVSMDSVPIGNIKFKLTVTADQQQARNEPEPSGVAAASYGTAFISYASEDRDEVLKRVQMLARLKINFFQDIFDLEPGIRWEKELYRHIDESDLFLLFWSSSAQKSEWVLKEVHYALERKGGDDVAPPEIVPVIIERPPVRPPAELAHLHFDDYLLYFMTK